MSRRRKRKRDSWRVDPADLDPKVAAGLAQGDEEIQEQEERYRQEDETPKPEGLVLARNLADAEKIIGTRVPLPKFIAEDADTSMVLSLGDDRSFRDVRKIYDPETLRAMKSGYLCFKCHEPQAYPFEDAHLDGCEGVSLAGPDYMKRRQIMDIAMEMEGEVHIGPSKPIKEYLQEQELRVEERRFEQEILEGKSRQRGARRG